MPAYYSEFDPKAAAWLRELIRRGLIADGVVDERDLWDVAPADLRGFTQVHLCAGIGVWSYAARRAGVSDDRRIWTASFPCQPFSAAGKGKGFADERHLWPAGLHLIRECRPDLVFGEQVSSPDGLAWLDLVQADLEGEGYAVGAADTCSAGVGAPHIRQRLYWVADAGRAGGMAFADGRQRNGQPVFRGSERDGQDARRAEGSSELESRSDRSGLADPASNRRRKERSNDSGQLGRDSAQRFATGFVAGNSDIGFREPARNLPDGTGAQREHGLREVAVRPGPVKGEWGTADWLYSRDGFWRPVEPGTFPLAHGAAARVGCVCAACLENSAEGADDEDLRALRKITGATDGCLPAEVLQPPVSMGAPTESARNSSSRPLASTAFVSEHSLRDVRSDRREPPASSGRKPKEQCAGEYPDSMPPMPQQSASCERCGATNELYAVTLTGNRIARLRGYGNAVNAEAAQIFIESYLEACG